MCVLEAQARGPLACLTSFVEHSGETEKERMRKRERERACTAMDSRQLQGATVAPAETVAVRLVMIDRSPRAVIYTCVTV